MWVGPSAFDSPSASFHSMVVYLRDKLAQFYANRTLLKRSITPADQAEAFFLLLSDRLKQSTGQIITVDGGQREAFLR